MAVASALFVPIAIGVGRLSTHPAMRVAVPVGIAAGVVQVVGLLRWPLLVPGFARDAASSDPASRPRPGTRSSWPTASSAPRRRNARLPADRRLDPAGPGCWWRWIARRWFTVLGAVSAVLILGGVLTPLQLPGVDFGNFIGYILWSVWLIIFAILILRHARSPGEASEPVRSAAPRTATS